MRLTTAIGCSICLLIAADSPKNDALNDQDKLQGAWELASGEIDGRALTSLQIKEYRLIIKADRYIVTLAEKGTVTGTEKLDATTTPKTIDITDESGDNKGKTCQGIYELKENEFRVAFASPGKPRPTKFTTAPESGQWMHVWKRLVPTAAATATR